MSQLRSFKSALFATTLSLSIVAAFATQAQADGKVECAKIKHPKVQSLCKAKSGSEKAIKSAMKDAQKAAKKAMGGKWKDGEKIKCTSCHKKSSGGELKAAESKKYMPDFAKYL